MESLLFTGVYSKKKKNSKFHVSVRKNVEFGIECASRRISESVPKANSKIQTDLNENTYFE